MTHHGQICFGTERIIVHEQIKQKFIDCLGAALKRQPDAGSAVSVEGAQKAQTILEEAIADGASYLFGTADFTGKASIQPSILSNINPESRINREESFAPSASLFTAATDEEAITLANNTPFGLSASIFTKDWERGIRMSRELDFGQVNINSMTIHSSSMTPVTGYKASGWGSQGTHYGIGEWLFNKHVSLKPRRSEEVAAHVNGH